MRALVWGKTFLRALKRTLRRYPTLQQDIEETLRLLQENPFEDEFIEKKYQELTQAIVPQERERIAKDIGNHLFEEFADIPMGRFANEVMAHPKVVSERLYPGPGAGRSTHFHMLKAAL